MATDTSRLGLARPQTSDPVSQIRASISDLADTLDVAALALQGTLAARPASTVGTPGLQGRLYWVTDTQDLYYDTGTSWVNVTDAAQQTLFDAKGDLLAGTGDDTAARLPAGANGAVLLGDSAQATGLRWGQATAEGLDGASVLDKAGISSAATVRRGKSIIAAAESRSSTSYGTLTTPDQVSNVVLPTDGLLAIVYQATWQESVAGAARAAIFIGANQFKAAGHSGSPVVQEADTLAQPAATDRLLATHGGGLYSQTGAAYSEVATGQAIGFATGNLVSVAGMTPGANGQVPFGGLCLVDVPAGTYTVSIQFKASSGSVTVKNRKLWVWTIGL